MARSLAAATFALALGACTSGLDRCAGERMIETTLYFGLTDPAGHFFAEGDWAAFRAEEIETRFPEGFTVLEGAGHWRDRETGGSAAEPARVLIRLHDGRDHDAITALIDRYKTRFDQQSVLRTDTVTCAVF